LVEDLVSRSPEVRTPKSPSRSRLEVGRWLDGATRKSATHRHDMNCKLGVNHHHLIHKDTASIKRKIADTLDIVCSYLMVIILIHPGRPIAVISKQLEPNMITGTSCTVIQRCFDIIPFILIISYHLSYYCTLQTPNAPLVSLALQTEKATWIIINVVRGVSPKPP
jgi:hypothetical protein